MPLGIAAEMSDEELAALEALRDPNEEPLPGDDEPGAEGDQPPQEPAASQAPPADEAETPKADATPPADDKQQQTADPEKPKGNRNQALRAARIAEQRARQEAETLRAELEELRKQVPVGKKGDDPADMTDEEIAELEVDFPAAAKAARMAKRAAEAVAKLTPAAAKQETVPDFEPPVLPPELQAAVDEVPDLLDWQHDPDQTRFEMAKATDGLLSRHPQWKDKPLEARFAEVVRRVNAELGAATPKPAANGRRDPMDVINNAPSRTPKSISEIGGGDGTNTQGPDVSRFSRMSTEDVEAELMARGG